MNIAKNKYMNNSFIILAAGNSERFKSHIPKSYFIYKGKPLLQHSIDKVKKYGKFKIIVLVVNKKHKKLLKKIDTNNVKIILGGNSRAESADKALKYLKKFNISKVFIHDAARPNFSKKLLDRLFVNLKKNNCVIPAINPIETVKLKNKKLVYNLDRNKIYLAQTPQAFNYKKLIKLQKNKENIITDDSSLFIFANKKIKIINGEFENKKITQKTDTKIEKSFKFGIGFDIHRLEPKRKLYLGGIRIPYHLGLKGHSDGDVIIHALIDALLGACKSNDIGTLFSDKKAKYKNIRSFKMLNKVLKLINIKGFYINNIDINVITQKPKIYKYRNKIIKSISTMCNIEKEQINIKGKTTEKLGLIGKEKAIACEVIASVVKYD
tara:strand:- start:1081 stop:2220 length:1140 start_codon:yes stop_codon:yes gene_type:complete